MQVECELEIVLDDPTKGAVAVWDGEADPDDYYSWIWLPRSQIEYNEDGWFIMPEWLARRNGFDYSRLKGVNGP